MSRGNLLDVSGCLRSKLTVWKEEQFIVLSGQGTKQREKRVVEWVAKDLPLAKPGLWGCVQARAQWSTEEDSFMRPGHHCLEGRAVHRVVGSRYTSAGEEGSRVGRQGLALGEARCVGLCSGSGEMVY